jgi:hypothetical protein
MWRVFGGNGIRVDLRWRECQAALRWRIDHHFRPRRVTGSPNSLSCAAKLLFAHSGSLILSFDCHSEL